MRLGMRLGRTNLQSIRDDYRLTEAAELRSGADALADGDSPVGQ